jgi:hypothetical protein
VGSLVIWKFMPLATRVSFEVVLEKGNRLQIPKLIRWQFKMEQNQVLRVGVSPKRIWGGPKFFLCQNG